MQAILGFLFYIAGILVPSYLIFNGLFDRFDSEFVGLLVIVGISAVLMGIGKALMSGAKASSDNAEGKSGDSEKTN